MAKLKFLDFFCLYPNLLGVGTIRCLFPFFICHYWSKDKLMATFSKENNII